MASKRKIMSEPRPRAQPHPASLFSLIPLNKQTAERIVNHEQNSNLVSFLPRVENILYPGQITRGLNIHLQIGTKSRYTLATIGRTGDIYVAGTSISRVQCSFEIHKDTQEILLYDRSTTRSTQTFGEKAAPFELDRPDRRVVVSDEVNTQFGFGGVACDLFKFEIHWHESKSDFQEQIANREDNPRLTRTVEDEIPTASHSPRTTLIRPMTHAPGIIRYYNKILLGRGSFGEVHKAVNIDSGAFFAIKLVKWPLGGIQSKQYQMLKREVVTIARLSHPNIAEFISAQGEGGPNLEIFTVLREGNIEDLIKKELFKRHPNLAMSLLNQMLQALDYLAVMDTIHRDIKPANILYQSLTGGNYTFQLTDFGLCNSIIDARTFAGSPIFMAPEMFSEMFSETPRQTFKVDVWSLFVTLVYTLNVNGFREKQFATPASCISAVQEAANDVHFRGIYDMAIIDPEARASAGDMLNKLFNGNGRSIPDRRMQRAPAPLQKERNHRIDEPWNLRRIASDVDMDY
ncbi:calcium calmodulin-dependent kinase [Pyrenophora seminiperda CCB06]|uniref:mitogen-activated protein kinase n=1 Tax=Pyrenophora seminiperda CCB06 TaxID=1302712 RepID=A0A3M7LZU1_9PLEO|nr:calcium calmodulin-dependent kinase [Pyrenophora seminiperda CCB06]